MRTISGFWHAAAAVCICALALAAGCETAQAEKRVALVIGNSAYVHVPRLSNPVNDAKLMAETLRGLGFTLVGNGAQLDLDKDHFDRVVQDFGSQLQGADVGLFYYAGHGVQVRGANYLVPVGANPVKEADVDFQMLDTNLVLRQMESAGARLNLVILDACRNNPFGGRGLRATSGGLAQMQAPEGTLISFATQPGNVALDGNGKDSPFTQALVQTIRKPGLGLFDAFNEVGLVVKRATGGAQQPWVSSSPISGHFYFAGRTPAVEQPPVTPPPPPVQAALPPPARPERPHSASERCASFGEPAGIDTYCVSSMLNPQFGNQYDAANLFSNNSRTAWVEGRPGQGVGEWVVVEFDHERWVNSITIHNGYQKNSDIFRKNSRVHNARIVFSNGQVTTVSWEDREGAQTLTLRQPIKVYWLQFIIESVYPGSKYTDTAISKLRVASERVR
jgi:Caspase domain